MISADLLTGLVVLGITTPLCLASWFLDRAVERRRGKRLGTGD